MSWIEYKEHLPPKKAIKKVIINLFLIALGSLIVAVSINAVLIPFGLLAGGVSGIALVIFYLFKIPVYLSILIMNIPIFWWGAREISRQFLFYSLAGTFALSAMLPATYGLIPAPQIDPILAAIFGGALNGVGLGLVFRSHGSTGGSDIIAVILKKKKDLGIGEVVFYSNMIVIIISLAFFPLNTGLYSILTMFMAGKLTDVVLTGLNTNKSVIIISKHYAPICSRIINELNRGVTYHTGIGAFTQEKRTIVNCVVNRFELAKLKFIVTEIDPEAFMYVSDASEVLGKGFTR
ncbi:MAG: YitT family protein [Desulfotomaculaceae bacterium]|nr:YitT family protein [Desulfotomaculaceae bacterium]